jgi:lysophospholipase L1-like esterase
MGLNNVLNPITLTAANTGLFTGTQAAIFGDSYLATFGTTWIPNLSVQTGLSFTLQDGVSGRPTQNIFSNYSSDPPTRLTQLAAALANIDVVLIELGTNDGQNVAALGNPGDPPTAATEYGYISNAIYTLQSAKPGLSIGWIGPFQYNWADYLGTGSTPAMTTQLVTAFKYVCASYGVPYLDMNAVSGINAENWATFLRDGVHMTDTAYANKFAPLIARFAAQYITSPITGSIPVPTIDTLPPPVNIFNYAAYVPSNLINANTGALIPGYAGFAATPLMDLRGSRYWTSNVQVAMYNTASAGFAYYDSTGTYLSGVLTADPGQAAGTVYTVPTGAKYLRFWWAAGEVPPGGYVQIMVIPGTTVPSSFIPYTAP